jgi:hypothetical protein
VRIVMGEAAIERAGMVEGVDRALGLGQIRRERAAAKRAAEMKAALDPIISTRARHVRPEKACISTNQRREPRRSTVTKELCTYSFAMNTYLILASTVITLIWIFFALEGVISTPFRQAPSITMQPNGCPCRRQASLLSAGALPFRSPFSEAGGPGFRSEGCAPVCRSGSAVS